MSLEIVQNERRKLLQSSVCAMLLEHGIQSAPNSVIETLVEMVQALIVELSRSAQSYSELCGRSSPLFVDVFIAMVEMGLNTQELVSAGRQKTKYHIPNPQIQSKPSVPKLLQIGDKKSTLSYIPDYYPPFPDSHAYIRTDTHKQPVTEYEAIREKASNQKRDLERALTRFMARTGVQNCDHSLFPDEQSSQLFPLIPINIKTHTYLTALLPRDQIFEDDQQNDRKSEDKKKEEESNQNEDDNDENKDDENENKDENDLNSKSDFNKENETENDLTDNPFLRPSKICKRRGGTKLLSLTK